MAIAILFGVLVLLALGAGLVIAIRMVAAARREIGHLEDEFDAHGSLALDPDSHPEPWSSVDLEILRDDVIVVEGEDPFDTLTEMISPTARQGAPATNGHDDHGDDHDLVDFGDAVEPTLHDAWDANGSLDADTLWHELDDHDDDDHDDIEVVEVAEAYEPEPEPEPEPEHVHEADVGVHTAASWPAPRATNGSGHDAPGWLASRDANGSDHEFDTWLASEEWKDVEAPSSTELALIEDRSPATWKPNGDAPIIILVVGVGFLGAGRTAARVTTAAGLRRAWGEFEDSFSQARVITLDPEARHAAAAAFDNGAERDGIVVDEDDGHEAFPPQQNDDEAISWPPSRSNGLGPRPNGEPKRIEWRCPDGVTVGR